VPDPKEKPDEEALPDPELNPLLNPLLAAHMGRWAEVYFTTPPERRGEAVTELLRELEASSGQPDSAVIDDLRASMETATEIKWIEKEEWAAPTSESPTEATELAVVCAACMHSNPQGHRFCGMCGALLQGSSGEPMIEVVPSEPLRSASWAEPKSSPVADHFDYADYRSAAAGEHHESAEPSIEAGWPRLKNRNDASDFPDVVPDRQNGVVHFADDAAHLTNDGSRVPDDLPDFAMEREPVPYRYRLYVGLGLAILLALLIYMARRGTEALSGGVQSPPSRVIPAAQPGAATAGPATAEAPNATGNNAARESRAKRENPPKQPVQSAKLSSASSEKKPTAVRPAPRVVPAANSSPPSAAQSGAQELAMAEKYLNGTQGATRDNRDAVQWLWKAVGKGNPAATIVLSDLYLRGDGVPKSCDQARLLLDAASRKGVRAAADRLRNLQAFGCK
jgi:hypothetical protein